MTSLKNVSEILICPWTRLWWMGATWLYEHKQNHKKSSQKLLVRFWNNLIEMFLEWPFSELFLKFWSVNKHSISEWRLLALYRHKEILVNSSMKARKKNWLEQSQKIKWAIQGHLGPLVSYDAPGVKTSPTTWGHKSEHRNKESNLQNYFFSGTGRCRDLIFCMWHLLENLYQVCS